MSDKKGCNFRNSYTVDRNHMSIDSHLWPGQLGDELAIPSLFVLIEMATVSTNYVQKVCQLVHVLRFG